MNGGSWRAWSPEPGGSTLMVSAPWSASSLAQNAPDGAWASSSTFTSESIPSMLRAPSRPARGRFEITPSAASALISSWRESRHLAQHRLVVLAQVGGVPDRHGHAGHAEGSPGIGATTARTFDRLNEFPLLEMRVVDQVRRGQDGAGANALRLQRAAPAPCRPAARSTPRSFGRARGDSASGLAPSRSVHPAPTQERP